MKEKNVAVSDKLKGNPPTGVIQNFNGADYIPIGQVEEMLDEDFEHWSITNFKFQIIRTDKFWFADASVLLIVSIGDATKTLCGAVTFQISSQDVNMDYSATALSYAIANAAKKLGKRYGRALNSRLTKGDVLPVIQLREEQERQTDDEITKAFEALKENIRKARNYDEAKALLETQKMFYRNHPELKQIVEHKRIT